MMGIVITIDGPAASGKTSVSRELSKYIGCPWVSTGAFYRGLAFAAWKSGIDLENPEAVTELAHSNKWRIELSDLKTRAYFEEAEVTDEINREDVGNLASKISQYPQVRQSLLDLQRACALDNDCLIAEGRDCGTIVFPHAEIKIYLTANSDNRAERRAQEQGLDIAHTAELQKQRDMQDSNRKVAPLQIPADALVLDTTKLDLKRVVETVIAHSQNIIDPIRKNK